MTRVRDERSFPAGRVNSKLKLARVTKARVKVAVFGTRRKHIQMVKRRESMGIAFQKF